MIEHQDPELPPAPRPALRSSNADVTSEVRRHARRTRYTIMVLATILNFIVSLLTVLSVKGCAIQATLPSSDKVSK